MTSRNKPKLAVIGSGISGMASAWLLRDAFDVTLFEKNRYLGGHTNTVDIDYLGQPISVDTGFIVYNEQNYPNLTKLFAQLDVATQDSEMSFAISAKGGKLEYGTRHIGEMFGVNANAANPRFWRMIMDLLRFYKAGKKLAKHGCDPAITLGQYLRRHRYGSYFIHHHIVPMTAAVWSLPPDQALEFPLIHFLNFCNHHGLLNVKNRPQWRTVSGGAKHYVQKLFADGKIAARTDCGVRYITRAGDRVQITLANQEHQEFDQVIIATHPDQALRLLRDADAEEQSALSHFRYHPNTAYLHRDPRLMPKNRTVWSSWNYIQNPNHMTLTYWMNCLQGIDQRYPLFVTLNPEIPPDQKLTFQIIAYDHPAYDHKTFFGQELLNRLQGRRNTWYCGAYLGFGFHEDGLNSAIRAAHSVNQTLPGSRAELSLAA